MFFKIVKVILTLIVTRDNGFYTILYFLQQSCLNVLKFNIIEMTDGLTQLNFEAFMPAERKH